VFDNPCDRQIGAFKKTVFDSCTPPPKRYMPIMSSHQMYTFNDSEKAIIDRLRDWSYDYFQSTQIFSNDTEMNMQEYMAKDGTTYFRDFDIIGKLNAVEWIDDQFCNLLFKDLAGVVYSLRVNTKRFRLPQKGEIVRVRGVKPMRQDFFVGSTRSPIVLDLNFYTNILHIPDYYKQARQLTERIMEDDVLKRLVLGSDNTMMEIAGNPHVVSAVSGEYMSLNVTNLADIFPPSVRIKDCGPLGKSLQMNMERNFFKVKAAVLSVIPANVHELTQLFCPRCVKTYSFKEMELDGTAYVCP